MIEIRCVCNNISKGSGRSLKSSWGLSFFVSVGGQKLLFDTGLKGDELLQNLEMLDVNPKDIKKIVISHNHHDHTGGLEELLKANRNNIDLYFPNVPNNLSKEMLDMCREKIFVDKNQEIIDHIVYSSGLIGRRIKEQSLCISSAKGFIVLTGCAHPGIIAILKEVKRQFNKNIYAVLGGFHMEFHPPFISSIMIKIIKNMGVKKIGPSHCTGKSALKNFKRIYKEDFIELNLGDGVIFV